MERREYDKSKWADGPWMQEPDRLDFEHDGLPCLMLRNDFGVWCGYVGVPREHPWFEVPYDGCTEGCQPEPVVEDIDERYPITNDMPDHTKAFQRAQREIARKADAAGGFMSTAWHLKHRRWSCYEHAPDAKVEVHGGLTYSARCQGVICHDSGQDVWWFGFDCGHAWDLSPRMEWYRHHDPQMRAIAEEYPSVREGEVYRDMVYVRSEVEKLADQLLAAWPNRPTRRIDLEA